MILVLYNEDPVLKKAETCSCLVHNEIRDAFGGYICWYFCITRRYVTHGDGTVAVTLKGTDAHNPKYRLLV